MRYFIAPLATTILVLKWQWEVERRWNEELFQHTYEAMIATTMTSLLIWLFR